MTSIGGDVASALAGRYRVDRELGRGGMATVYLAEDLKHKRRVAIKVQTWFCARSSPRERLGLAKRSTVRP